MVNIGRDRLRPRLRGRLEEVEKVEDRGGFLGGGRVESGHACRGKAARSGGRERRQGVRRLTRSCFRRGSWRGCCGTFGLRVRARLCNNDDPGSTESASASSHSTVCSTLYSIIQTLKMHNSQVSACTNTKYTLQNYEVRLKPGCGLEGYDITIQNSTVHINNSLCKWQVSRT
jgi:hypothetical protein